MPEGVQEIGNCKKYFLFSSNVFFWLIGLAMIGIGIWAWSEKGTIKDVLTISHLSIDPIFVLMFIAGIMFIVSFTGCVGSLRDNIHLLKAFVIFLAMIFLAELILGILGFVYTDWFRSKFNAFINETIHEYRDDPDLQNLIDFTQLYLECCGGSKGPNDWDNNIYFNCSSLIAVNGIDYKPIEACGVPYSCCISDTLNTQCGFGMREPSVPVEVRVEKIYTAGCSEKFEDFMKVHLYSIAGLFIGVAIMQIIPILFANSMIEDIKLIKASWEVQEIRRSSVHSRQSVSSVRRASSRRTSQMSKASSSQRTSQMPSGQSPKSPSVPKPRVIQVAPANSTEVGDTPLISGDPIALDDVKVSPQTPPRSSTSLNRFSYSPQRWWKSITANRGRRQSVSTPQLNLEK